MKNIQVLALCFLIFSCSPDSESPPVESPEDNESNTSLSYEPKGVPFTKPKIEVMEVSQSEININWFTP